MRKKMYERVVVITGASSGIGRETALAFGRKGASVVLAARSAEALHDVATEIRDAGGRAHVVVTDVSVWTEVQQLADEAVIQFGGLDVWVNNAAVEEWATFEDHTPEELEQIIRVNLLGTMFGAKAALERLREGGGGSIINVGSIESRRVLPYQSAYAAAKHGVKAFTEVLRMELKHAKLPIDVTLILPGSINTPLFSHARTKIGAEPKPIPPVYEPQAVAEAIVFAVDHPRRHIVVGGGGKVFTLMDRFAPGVTDRVMVARGAFFKGQKSRRPPTMDDNLFEPSATHSTRGEHPGHGRSLYTRIFEEHHPNVRRAVVGGLVIGAAAMLMRSAGKRTTPGW